MLARRRISASYSALARSTTVLITQVIRGMEPAATSIHEASSAVNFNRRRTVPSVWRKKKCGFFAGDMLVIITDGLS